MKTYEWMAGRKGNAHWCERGADQASAPRPVCGVSVADLIPALAQSKCVNCLKQEAALKKYQEAMKGKS